ncbi:hypothetical protein M8C13_06510 [Crossiella sp. SN42]|uniref:hypothetical protein n=1 Tax=Crossiella sp. SN42 TaxID=2944808 RepID=UPI00207CF77C|nr:hypothetical protein [Crossiella sp. SN42]MCO1575412.1 hypothetical protein [Crossiella sp. SN42]
MVSGHHGDRERSSGAEQLSVLLVLPYTERTTAIAAFARALSAPQYRAIWAELDIDDQHQRELGLFLAVARRDLETLVNALLDPQLRPWALAATVRLPVPDDVLHEVLRTAPRRDRLLLYRTLRQSRRRGLADEFLPVVAQRFDLTEARALLTACSPSMIGVWLPKLGATPALLRGLARVAPEAVLAHLTADLPGLAEPGRWNWQRRHGGLLTLLFRRIPGAVARALVSTEHAVSIAEADQTPRLAAAIVRAVGDDLPSVFGRIGAGGLGRLLLRALPEGERLALLDQVYPGQVAAKAEPGLLAELPEADRVPLARAALALERDPRLEFEALLPPAEATAALAGATGSHRVLTRAQGWRVALARAARGGDPAAFASAAREAVRALHDQDRVRTQALAQLRLAPSRLLAAVPVPALAEAVTTVVTARDSSKWTFEALDDWLRRTIAADADPDRRIELVPLLARLHRDRRAPARRLALRLPSPVWARLWASMREPVLHEAAGERFGPALRAAEMFGTNLDAAPELDELMWRIAKHGNDIRQVETAIRCWLAGSGQRAERVRRIVRHNPAWGAQPAVWREVSTRQTDLLDLVLPAAVPPRTPRSVPHRWTAAQRELAARRAEAVALDERNELWQRVDAVSGIRSADTLITLTDNKNQPIVAAAVTELGASAPVPVALPVLLRIAGGPSGPAARAAVRALRRALDAVPDAEAVAVLGNLLAGPRSVGTAKEAVRILGTVRGSEAAGVLLRLWAEPGLHQDVRAAVAGALTGFLGEPGVRAALAEAVAGPPAVREAVLRTAVEQVAPPLRPVFAGLVGRALSLARTDTVPELNLAFGAWWRYLPDCAAALGELLAQDLPMRLYQRVAENLLRSVPGPEALPALRSLVDGLAAAARDGDDAAWRQLGWLFGARALNHPDPAGQAELDRVLVDGFRTAGMLREAAHLLDVMARESLTRGVRVELWDELVATIDERAFRLPREARYGGLYEEGVPAETVLAVVDHLGGLGEVVPGLLAARLVRFGGKRARWSGPWVARRELLLGHADADVRAAVRGVRVGG